MKTKLSVADIDDKSGKPIVVAVIASRKDLLIALRHPDSARAYEWRVDLTHGKRTVEGIERLKRLGKLIILTVRDPNEGGQRPKWHMDKRVELIRKYMHLASMVDVEIRLAVKLRELVEELQRAGIRVVFSFHVLEPVRFEIARVWLESFADIFESLGADEDVFKVAVNVEDSRDMSLFSRYFYRLMKQFPCRIAPMPIGEKYGKRLRLEYARRGAALVYCYLGEAVIAGQWQVSELQRRLN